MKNEINLIYLLGAGRSGTTLLATLLNNHKEIDAIGEMHQFFEYIDENKNCSCGVSISQCKTWNISNVFSEVKSERTYCEIKERHANIPNLLFTKKQYLHYNNIQNELFKVLSKHRNSNWFLDSSKYIARFLLLNKNNYFNVKGVYLVRDPRGVIFSFKKKVQTSKNALSAILYYNIINLFAEVVYRRNKNVLKVKYEDLIDNPEETLSIIYTHIFEKEIHLEKIEEYYNMPHIVGGNRIKKIKKINLKKDSLWHSNIPRLKQIIYYYLCLPFVLINKYKL